MSTKQSKKRNKAYKKKIVCNPLGIRNKYQFEIPVLVAVSNVESGQFSMMDLSFVTSLACLTERMFGPKCNTDAVLEVTDAITERFESSGKLSSTPDEIRTIKENFPPLMEFFRAQSNYNIVTASSNMIQEIKREEAKK